MTTSDLVKIRDLHAKGLRIFEIANATGLSRNAVGSGLKFLGLKNHRVQYAVYDKHNNGCLIAMGPLEEVAKIMGVSVTTARTYTSRPYWRYEVVRVD